jgi:hypothetical protein
VRLRFRPTVIDLPASEPLGVPGQHDWDTSKIPESRRRYLEAAYSFEGITALVIENVEITRYWIEPLRTPPKPPFPRDFQQVCFRIRTSKEAYDLFFNAPDGLRGRFWQSPEVGDSATRHLIDSLKRKILARAEEKPDCIEGKAKDMTIDEVRASLEAPSAKVWVRERDDKGNMLISLSSESGLIVRRWQTNESNAPKGPLWRWTPCSTDLEIKGAIIRNHGRAEHIPEDKRRRSLHIHCYGWT